MSNGCNLSSTVRISNSIIYNINYPSQTKLDHPAFVHIVNKADWRGPGDMGTMPEVTQGWSWTLQWKKKCYLPSSRLASWWLLEVIALDTRLASARIPSCWAVVPLQARPAVFWSGWQLSSRPAGLSSRCRLVLCSQAGSSPFSKLISLFYSSLTPA